jgi:hypothetical protein
LRHTPDFLPLVLHVLFFGASWFFRRGFWRVSVG